MKKALLALTGLAIALSCAQQPATLKSGLDPKNFESEIEGKKTALYTLKNANGMEVCITNFGARIVSVMVPDKDGNYLDVVLAFDNINDFKTINSDFGAAIGRYANRINGGKITIDDVEYQLPKNNFGHCLHGGPQGWQYKVFDAEQISDNEIKMTIDSPDGDSSFPGNVIATVTYTLTDDNAIDIRYNATTDKPTIINMTNHSYFNLSGNPTGTATDHIMYINADNYTPVDNTFMTTGEIAPVAGTPMDFTVAKAIEKDINADFEQLKNGNGYDHNWVLNTAGDVSKVAASLYHPGTGIMLEVFTNEPGIQVYTGNFLDGTVSGKKGITYQNRASVCLETQHYPDSPNKKDWPSVILRPGETYNSVCIYKFSVK